MTIHRQTDHRRGAEHPRARLSDADVERMRAMHKPGVVGYETLAREFKCGTSTARDICKNRTRMGD